MLDTEKERYDNLRQLKGKEPKIEKGANARAEKDRYILGCMIDNIMGQVRLVELSEGRNMFFDFSVPLKDGRTLSIALQATK